MPSFISTQTTCSRFGSYLYGLQLSHPPLISEAIQLPDSRFPFTSSRNDTNTSCRLFPGDSYWLSPETWSLFNETLDGSSRPFPWQQYVEPYWPQYNQVQHENMPFRLNIFGFCRSPSTKKKEWRAESVRLCFFSGDQRR